MSAAKCDFTIVKNREAAQRLASKNRDLLGVKEAAAYLGVSKSYLDRGRIQDYGPEFIQFPGAGKHGIVRYRRTVLDEWLTSNERKPGGVSNV